MASSSDATASTNERPEGPAASGRRGRVRLKRAAVMAVPATAVAAGLMIMTAQGALGVQFAISGMPFVVTADKLDGEGFAQFGALDHMIENSPNEGDTGGQVLVVTSVVKNGKLTNLCQSVDLGGIQLVLTAGNKGTPVSVKNLAIDSDDITGDASFNNIEIGRDSSTFDKVDQKGQPGVYGQQADSVVITDLYQHNYAATAAVFKLPDLHMRFQSEGCD
ncbi:MULTISPECIES: DUF6230 family protein [Streptomyces]|uniref:Cholesterol esterase n=1 Tax=Streptomyces caniscabiei TaxID=2746961 RepID=A0A927LAD9_9ACTN|nr:MULTISPECIES: DUF6230 family protein [Streptomyces]MBD9727044.1 cholesterol esterase [Streptomyces caniscabiei]MBE4734457.1 cholesterol esterase [Streptomyces caniscabiei]MBE4755328.1 cholesterol esterase [Streptomyces caniscabiei]MBE4772548.1 cholesterol esterase [Streptomyces caniscabiei]MBE4783387.1 cholesterol esterase [Streptomyces caniscabiei]